MFEEDDSDDELDYDFPEAFVSGWEDIGSYTTESDQRFTISVDEEGFGVTKHYGKVSAYTAFCYLDYWPEYSRETYYGRRLSEILDRLNEFGIEEAESAKANLLRYYAEHISPIIEFEQSKDEEEWDSFRESLRLVFEEEASLENQDDDVRKFIESYRDSIENPFREGPVTCKSAPEPEYCALEIYWNPEDSLWRLEIMGDSYIDIGPDDEYYSFESFRELIVNAGSIGLRWGEERIKKVLIDADSRWARFIEKG